MPGIHLRTLSHFDWLDSEKDSLLTIPGSYWLCHKKNIYKFIFRYHRTVRNTVEFLYGRELLKIIRRIIKCHPTQGQQFSTKHLLVTYNCTSWTRQDKMFAILKFQQRTNAAAFSYAFVLTISICSSPEPLFDLKYSNVNKADTEKKSSKTVICATGKSSLRKIPMCRSKKEDHISKFNDKTLNTTSKLTISSNLQDDNMQNTEMYHINEHTKLQDSMIYENKSIDYNMTNCERDKEQHITNLIQEEFLGAKKGTNEIEIKTSNINQDSKSIAIQKQNQEIQNIPMCKIFSSLKFSVTGIRKESVDKFSVSNKFNFDRNLIEENNTCIVNNKDGLDNNKKMTNETIVDSNNVPSQYFIEKESENTKHNTKLNMFLATDQQMQTNLKAEIKNINKDTVRKMKESNMESIQAENEKEHYDKIPLVKSQRNDNQHIRTLMNDDQSQNNVHNKWYKARKQKGRESEKKIILEDKVLRSSNITDLVMEGLMFTIRQDQDSIAVIEQKTKLEVDEVLENSEKVETKAGEKCLLNSSLLRLENLVTMIDSSHYKDEHRKIGNAINSNVYSSSFNILHNNSVHNVDVNFVDKRVDKSSVLSYNNLNTMSYLTPYESRWQYFSSDIKNSNNFSISGNTIEKRSQLIEWQSDNEQNRKDGCNSEMEKEEDILDISLQSPIFSSDKINAGLQSKDLPMNDTNIEGTGKCDTSTERHSSLLSFCSSSPSKMSSKEISTISEQSDSDKLFRQEANLPRIISDKAVTIEQIPLALQNIVHTYRKRKFSSTTDNEEFQRECKMQQHNIATLTGNTISNTISLDSKCINSPTANNSSFIKLVDSEEMISKKNKSCVTIDKNIQETATHVKNIKEKNNDFQRTLSEVQRNSFLKHDSSRKLQDITEDFYYDLLHVHNKGNAVQQRCLREKRRSPNNSGDIKNNKIRIEMLKFIQDITEGAKVVVKRLNVEKKETVNSIC